MRKLEIILGTLAIAGLITSGIGFIAKNKIITYVGAGTAIVGTCGVILSSKPQDNDYSDYKQDKHKE